MISMWHSQKYDAKLQSMSTTFTIKKLVAAAVLLLVLIIKATLQYTCTSTSSTEIFEYGYESSFSLSSIKKIVEGPVSGDFYYLAQGSDISRVQKTTIVKLNISENPTWSTSFLNTPIMKSLSIDSSELNIYYANYLSTISVIRLQASTGSIIDGKSHSGINGLFYDIKICVLSSNSGYYIYGINSSNSPIICKYLYSTPSESQCMNFSSLKLLTYGLLMMDDSKLFFLAIDNSSDAILFISISFDTRVVNWSKSKSCLSSGCLVYESESALSPYSSQIYSFFTYQNPQYLYFTTLNATSGNPIGTLYKSSIGCSYVYGFAETEYFLAATVKCSTDSNLLIFNKGTSDFKIKKYIENDLYSLTIETITGRLVFGGSYSTLRHYISKSMFNSIGNTDFTTSTLSMIEIIDGTIVNYPSTSLPYLITTSIVSQFISILDNVFLSNKFSKSYNVHFQKYFQQIYLRENSSFNIYPSLPCTTYSSEVIIYSLGSYNGVALATWMSIDPTTGQISGKTPIVSANSDFNLFVNSQIGSSTELSQKWIRISVVNCEGSNQPTLCKNDPYCGDGVFMSYMNELCDDGNVMNGDGCSSTCQIELGYSCTFLPSKNFVTIGPEGSKSYCTRNCMNSYIDSGEQCDDGNSINGDGCDRDCQKESGFICDNNKIPSFCFPACGDGYRNGTEGEECDDRNNVNYDGCSSICKVEPNYACSNATGVDICKTIYQAPKIISKGLVLEKLKISIEFDEIMMKQELTNFDLRLDIYGVNAPYYVTWNANFDQNKLIIDFVCSPVLIGGSIETINLILIDTKKFKSLHEIPLISSQEFIFNIQDLPPDELSYELSNGILFLILSLVLFNFFIFILTNGSIELMWSLANTLQIIYYYILLDLNFTPELRIMFIAMKYSHFENPVFKYMRDLCKSFDNSPSSSNFLENIEYSSFNILVNYIDKIAFIFLFICFIMLIWLFYNCIKNKSNKCVQYFKQKEIDLRYERLSRLFMENCSSLSVAIWINLIYTDFVDIFDYISYSVAIILMILVLLICGYCFIYPIIYYSEILIYPEIHERHCLLFLEFNRDNIKNLFFYGYFILHRFIFALLMVCFYSMPGRQCFLICVLNLAYLKYTFKVFKNCLQNFLHIYNCIIQFVLSVCLMLFLSPDNPDKLKICGYICIAILALFFVTNCLVVFPSILIQFYRKVRECCHKKTSEEIEKEMNAKTIIRVPQFRSPSQLRNNQASSASRMRSPPVYNKEEWDKVVIERINPQNNKAIREETKIQKFIPKKL